MNVVTISGKLIAKAGVFLSIETKERLGRDKHFETFIIKPVSTIRKIALERLHIGQTVMVKGKLKTFENDKLGILFEQFEVVK